MPEVKHFRELPEVDLIIFDSHRWPGGDRYYCHKITEDTIQICHKEFFISRIKRRISCVGNKIMPGNHCMKGRIAPSMYVLTNFEMGHRPRYSHCPNSEKGLSSSIQSLSKRQ